MKCGIEANRDALQNLCACGGPLGVTYDVDRGFQIDSWRSDLWRYRDVLPEVDPLSLGEGWTPLTAAPQLGRNWFVKDESLNPTGSFKARGMAVAVAMAKKLGATSLAVPSAGNAGCALAAYAAAANLESHVFMPSDTPHALVIQCRTLGAKVTLINGLITDCARELQARKPDFGYFEMSTFREPFRVEGKKTMAYELFEQLDKRIPDVVIYPTGGGTGLVAMARAFDEMQALNWIGDERPRLVCVQASGCRPIVKAFQDGKDRAEEHAYAQTIASGLRVPRTIADFAILRILRETRGTAVSVNDGDMISGARELAKATGIFSAPEGGATLRAARELQRRGWIGENETVVLFNTGTGLSYTEAFGG